MSVENGFLYSWKKTTTLKSRGPDPDSLTWTNMAVRHWQIASQELLTDPDCAPESAKSVSTSRTAHMRETG